MNKQFLILLLFIGTSVIAHDNKTDIVTYYISDKSSAPLQLVIDNQQRGIVSDVISSLNIKNVSFDFEVLPFKRMIKNMASNDNVWISYGSSAWPGPQSTSLSETALINVQHVFLTQNDTRYHKIKDFFGETIVIIRGFDYPGLESYFRNNIINVLEVKTHQQAIEAVLKGRAIAFPEMRFRLAYHLSKNLISADETKLYAISDIIPDYDINLCFSKTFPAATRVQVEQRLREMKYLGEIEDIVNQYRN